MTKVKYAISSVAMLAAFIGSSAYAADLGRGGMKDAPVDGVSVDRGVNWSGVYLGVQGGYMNANHEISADESCSDCEPTSFNLFKLDGLNSSGFLGGGSVGLDRQFGNWVLGIQAYYHFTNVDTKLSAIDGAINASLEKDNEYGGVVRVGRLLSPNVLAYGLGGYNWTKYRLKASVEGTPVDFTDTGVKTSNTFGGVILGGGVEYALTSNIFVGAEYTHFFGGKEDWFRVTGEGGSEAVTDNLDEDRIMLTAKVKFGGGILGN